MGMPNDSIVKAVLNDMRGSMQLRNSAQIFCYRETARAACDENAGCNSDTHVFDPTKLCAGDPCTTQDSSTCCVPRATCTEAAVGCDAMVPAGVCNTSSLCAGA